MQTERRDGDRRRFNRVGFRAEAVLKFPIGSTPVDILDISLAGALLKVDSAIALEDGSSGSLIIKLSDQVQIKLTGNLVSHGDGKYALNRNLDDPENDNHLRRLLELNLGDAVLVERDIQTLIAEYQQAC